MKINRQSKIIELINQYDIETQEELADRLNTFGFDVTQATISRDIRELDLIKITDADGRQKYAVRSSAEPYINDKLIRIFRDAVLSMDYAQNMLVIRTLTGMANAVAAALDAMRLREIIGTIAGDDTILCVLKNEQLAIRLMEKLNSVVITELIP